jgi:hypothetical protein
MFCNMLAGHHKIKADFDSSARAKMGRALWGVVDYPYTILYVDPINSDIAFANELPPI